MSNTDDKDNIPVDSVLADLSQKIDSFNDVVEKNPEYAVFCVGVKTLGDENTGSVQTYINVAGAAEVISEGLYNELSDQLKNGDHNLFAVLAEVIHELEDEFLSQEQKDEEIDDGDEVTFH